MKKKIITILFLMFFPFFISAYSKEDIIALVSEQKLCDAETETIYNQYFESYSRILKLKDIDEKLAGKIYAKLSSALDIVKANNICSVNDLDKINEREKDNLYNLLLDGSKLIFKAPSLEDKKTNITINSDSTIDIYESGKLVEKIDLKGPKFNYVGYELWFILLKYLLPISFLCLIIFLFIYKKEDIIKHFTYVSLILILILNLAYFIAGEKLYDIYTLINTMSINLSEDLTELKVKNKKILNKPDYGSKYALLEIVDLNIELPVYYGDSKKILREGIGHTTTSSLPGEGKNIIYSAHNTNNFLANLKNIKKDTLINITTSYGTFEYQVTGTKILKTSEYNKLKKIDKEQLILYTCYPFDKLIYSESRMIVYASLTEEKWFDE